MEPSPTVLGSAPAAVPAQADPLDERVLRALRAGDPQAFTTVVTGWSPSMLRLARAHVSTEASAQEVVQETWLAVVRGLDGFEGRSTLRTWAFRILVNTAKTRGVQERRVEPVSSFSDDTSPTVDPARFRGPEDRWHRHWSSAGAPQPWRDDPERGVLRTEVRELLSVALDELPERQRTVVVLRDVEAHLGDCTACAAYLQQVRDTVAALGGTRDAAAGLQPETVQGLLAAFARLRPPG